MTVDADNACPFCDTTITYEPVTDSPGERYVFNRYLVLHLVKQSWFAVLCLLTVVIRLLVVRPAWDPFLLFPVACLGISLILSFFGRRITRAMQWKYSPDYAAFRTDALKVLLGAVAVVVSFVIR